VHELKLFLFGAPRIERNGAQIDIDTRKAIALLAYLVMSDQRQRRDALAALFWPEYDQTSARGALRRTLSALNKALGGVGLDIDRETIGVDRAAGLWVDVEQFERLIAASKNDARQLVEACEKDIKQLSDAVALYHDDFMVGFSLRDSPAFDDWQFFQAESLRRALAWALEHLVHCYTLLGAFDLAIGHARRWLALDPLHEPAHRQLMLLYVWSGQRAAAIHQYRECVRVLDQELGVPPLQETTQVYQAITENQAPSPPLRIADVGPALIAVEGLQIENATPPPSNPQSPLVGRAAEWRALLEAYTAAGSGGRLVVIAGEAGIGKTRLAEELLEHARSAGATTIIARCYEGETNLAYGPFIEGLRSTLRKANRDEWLDTIPARWLSETTRLLPELEGLRPDLPPAMPLDTAGAQSRLFEAISQVLIAACRGPAPGIVLLDDLQWADVASLDLLAYLARRLHDYPFCLLVTWRAESMPASHRGRAILAEAQRAGAATLLSLSRLSRSAVMDLVRLAGAVAEANPEELGARLYEETEGLPFFLVEYLAALARGSQSDQDNSALPNGVRDLLQARLALVDETAGQVLTTAAVIGRSFDYDTLREASGRGEEETVAALEQLIAQGLIQELHNGAAYGARPTYDFYHEKLRALVYEQISLARRRLLHRRVAEALVNHMRSSIDRGPLAGLIAYHYQLAGQDAAAAEQFALAGEHARRLYANADALAHFQSALALGHPQVSALHEAVGDLHTLLGAYRTALQSYETAAALQDPEALPRIERKLADIYRRRGEWEQAESHLQAALDAIGEHEPAGERARIYSDWSLTAHRRGESTQAQELARRALQLAEEAGDTRALADAHNILGILGTRAGEFDAACQHLERSLALAEQLGDDSARAAALNNLALAYSGAGAADRALALAEQALTIYAAQGDRHREAALHNTLADLLYAAGRSEEAMVHLKQAVTIFAEIGADAGEMQPEIWKLVEW